MARKGRAVKRKIEKDPVYGSVLVSRLINRSMYEGKKSVAQKEVYRAFEIIKTKTNDEPLSVFEKAVETVKPEMEVRSRRVGGAAYQVPTQVRGDRKISLALRWLITAARARSNSEFHTYGEKLAQEILDVLKGEGGAIKKKQDVEKQAEANKAFSHFKW
jgi:small subunit ribosomal protein S7